MVPTKEVLIRGFSISSREFKVGESIRIPPKLHHEWFAIEIHRNPEGIEEITYSSHDGNELGRRILLPQTIAWSSKIPSVTHRLRF